MTMTGMNVICNQTPSVLAKLPSPVWEPTATIFSLRISLLSFAGCSAVVPETHVALQQGAHFNKFSVHCRLSSRRSSRHCWAT